MRATVKKQATDRLSRIGGQVRGVTRMVTEESYCLDVLSQLNSISAAIDGLRVLLLDDHLRTCITEAVQEGTAEERFEELEKALRRVLRA